MAPYQEALERGHLARMEWIKSGFLVPSEVYAAKLEIDALDLQKFEERGELFSIVVDGISYYPSDALKMPFSVMSGICAAFKGKSPSERMVFIMRKHGALGGKTVAQAVEDGELANVLQLVKSWQHE